MKKLLAFLSLFLFVGFTNAQQASDYFPTQTGFEWKFKAIPLDSLNNPINPLAVFRIDSFAAVTNYEGKLANIVLTKTGSLDSILAQPYIDTLFYHTDGTDGYEYFSINRLKEYILQLDSLNIDSTFSFLEFFTSLQDWYPVYQFASTINTEYLLKQVDENIAGYPIRFKYVATRLPDETVQTVLGALDCKKFLVQWKVLAFFVLEVLRTSDTIWIAQDNWIVQDIIPFNTIDLSLINPNIPPTKIPGLETKLSDEIVSVENEASIPTEFTLEQNYPNPFNPNTKIRYTIPQSVILSEAKNLTVQLKVYNVLGKEIATLVDEPKPAGSYEVQFDGIELPSGIYFYQLKAGSFIETKKMVLLK